MTSTSKTLEVLYTHVQALRILLVFFSFSLLFFFFFFFTVAFHFGLWASSKLLSSYVLPFTSCSVHRPRANQLLS